MDPDSIFARVSDSKRNFNGFVDPAIAAVRGFHRFLGSGFWILLVIKFG